MTASCTCGNEYNLDDNFHHDNCDLNNQEMTDSDKPTHRELIENTRAHYAKQYDPLEAAGIKAPKNSILDLCDRLESVLDGGEIAIVALKKYGVHTRHCDMNDQFESEWAKVCTCGFDKAKEGKL